MSKSRKAVVKMRKENAEMNKKYLDTRPESLEAAVYQSANTEVPVNPNSLRPTLHLPKKYLETREGSLERAVEEALVSEGSKEIKTAVKMAKKGGGAMTPTHKKIEKKYPGMTKQKHVKAAMRKYNEDSEYAKKTREQAVDVINAIQFGKPFKVVDEQEIPSGELREKEVDAIRAYDKSKDASRDADWDTVHGKIQQGKKEKKYAKKERGEIDKDDPNWKSRSYHTGMHGEETEMTPLIQATMEKIHFMRDDKLSYKERQKLPSGSFALPGKGSGPEGKQGGSYPIPDESHARNALARVSQHGSEAEKAKVRKAVSSKYPNIKISEGEWADEKRKEKESSDRLLKIHQEREARYQAQQAAKKKAGAAKAESKEDDRGVGSAGYANYVKGLTPGEESDSAVKSKDAKKASSESKKASDERERQATRIDDEYVPTLEEYAAHLDSLDEDALETELETLNQNELLEILGTGLVKKAAGAIKKRFSTSGRLAAAKKKAAKIQTKTDLATTKTSNIAAKAKLKDAKAKLRAAKGPGILKKAIGAAPKKPVKVKSVPGKGIVAAEYEPESLIGLAMDELSKKVLGRYVKKAAHDTAGAGIDLGVSSQKKGGQTRKDVDKHAGKLLKRQRGIGKAVDKLSK